nr:DUF362 domain-containing protein [Candidatus Sigynarchaeota archaeon]
MISIVQVDSTRRADDVKPAIARMLGLLGYKPSKSNVFIKPNIVDAVGPKEAVDTDPVLVEGLVLALHEQGIGKEFIIGDGSAYFSNEDRNWKRLIEDSGYEAMTQRLVNDHGIKASLVNLECQEREEYQWKFGKLSLPALCRSHAYIDVAKMKTHLHTLVTLSMKNQKGLLTLADKKQFHLGKKYHDLHDAIKELGNIVKPELAIIDATRALEGSGPATNPDGQTKVRNLKMVLAGTNMIEVDAAACIVMGIQPGEVRHLPPVQEPIEVVPGSNPLVPVDPPFLRPKLEVKMSDSIYRHTFETCCTGCQMSLSRMFRKIMFTPELREKFVKFQQEHARIDVVMGKIDPEVIRKILEKNG